MVSWTETDKEKALGTGVIWLFDKKLEFHEVGFRRFNDINNFVNHVLKEAVQAGRKEVLERVEKFVKEAV